MADGGDDRPQMFAVVPAPVRTRRQVAIQQAGDHLINNVIPRHAQRYSLNQLQYPLVSLCHIIAALNTNAEARTNTIGRVPHMDDLFEYLRKHSGQIATLMTSISNEDRFIQRRPNGFEIDGDRGQGAPARPAVLFLGMSYPHASRFSVQRGTCWDV